MSPTRRLASPAVLAAMLVTVSAPATTHAYSITSYTWNEPITLNLADGRQLEGRFRGMLGKSVDRIDYAEQYEAWRSTRGSTAAPAFGETLLVTLEGGASVRGAFRGLAHRALLLATEDSCLHLVVVMDKHTRVHRVREADSETGGLAAQRLWKSAPSRYAVVVDVQGTTFAVPMTMVAPNAMLPTRGSNAAATVATGVLVGVLLLSLAAAAAMASALSQPMI